MTPQWYLDYLATPRWRAISRAMIARANHRCQSEGCWSRYRLQVHHLTYDHLGDERICDVKVLCDGCHRRAHGLPPAPWTRAARNAVHISEALRSWAEAA